MARSIPLLAAALAVLVLAAPAALAASSAPAKGAKGAKGAKAGSKHGSKGNACPNAEQCQLATYDDLGDLFGFLIDFLVVPVRGFAEAILTPEGGCVADGSDEFEQECAVGPVNVLAAYNGCPDGYINVSQDACFGYLFSSEGDLLAVLPNAGAGALGSAAYCYIDYSSALPLPAGATVVAQMTTTCTQNTNAFEGASAQAAKVLSGVASKAAAAKASAARSSDGFTIAGVKAAMEAIGA